MNKKISGRICSLFCLKKINNKKLTHCKNKRIKLNGIKILKMTHFYNCDNAILILDEMNWNSFYLINIGYQILI